MAINQVGIYPNTSGDIGSKLQIRAADGTISLVFRFATQSNSWLTCNVWVTVDGVRKGGNEAVNGYATLGASGATNISRTSLSAPIAKNGTYIYSVPLSLSAMSSVASLIGTLSYASRSYDAFRLKVEASAKWGAGAEDFVKGSSTCYITFIPAYTATGATYTVNGLEITYTASGWSRPNDRWQTNAISSDGELTASANLKGTAQGAGKLTIPRKNLKRIPGTGETLSGGIKMRGSWQDDASYLSTMSLAGITVTNATTLKSPTFTATPQSDGVLVKWTGTTGAGTAPDAVDVQMVGSDYIQDRWTFTAVNEEHLFDAVPSGIATDWQAVGYIAGNDAYQPTPPVSATAAAIVFEGISLVPADGSGAIALPYNLKVTRDYSPETETAKLAGRKRPTVGFGEGGEGSWKISGTVITGENTSLSSLTSTDIDALASLPERGICMLRTQDGRRAQVYIKSATISREFRGVRGISIDADEVAS